MKLAGRPIAETNPRSDTHTTVYDYFGDVWATIDALEYRVTYGYDVAGQLVRLRHSKADDTELAGFEYALNALGMPTSLVDARGDRVTWSYDAALRLTREQRSSANACDVMYTFDGAGNRLTKVAGGLFMLPVQAGAAAGGVVGLEADEDSCASRRNVASYSGDGWRPASAQRLGSRMAWPIREGWAWPRSVLSRWG